MLVRLPAMPAMPAPTSPPLPPAAYCAAGRFPDGEVWDAPEHGGEVHARMARQLARVVAVARDARLALGWSQQQLGELVGLSRQAIGDFERGAAWTSLPKLLAIANVLQLQLTAARDWDEGRPHLTLVRRG